MKYKQINTTIKTLALAAISTAAMHSGSVSAAMPANAYLSITQGTDNTQPGSYFGMEVAPGLIIYTGIAGVQGIHLGFAQYGSTFDIPNVTNIDNLWGFFGNNGLHLTTVPTTINNDDNAGNVELGFSGWAVSWNGIQSIPMGSGAHGSNPDGIAIVSCSTDCSFGDTYSLDYTATVPAGDPSGFGNVKYTLHLEGSISATPPAYGGGNAADPYVVTSPVSANSTNGNGTVTPGETAAANSNNTGSGLTSEQVGIDPLLNPTDGEQCIGGCVDFTISSFSGDYAEIVFHLDKPLPSGTIYRKLIDGKWQNFDESDGSQLGSATATNGKCQSPDGVFPYGLLAGNECIFMRIVDGGVNDADGTKDGVITDPGGVLSAGSPNTPASSTDGCSMSGNTTNLMHRADWLLIAGFMLWAGLVARKKQS